MKNTNFHGSPLAQAENSSLKGHSDSFLFFPTSRANVSIPGRVLVFNARSLAWISDDPAKSMASASRLLFKSIFIYAICLI